MDAVWAKSTLSFSNGNCVEVTELPGGAVGVRNSRDPGGPVLRFSRDEWDAFLGGARLGEFDRFGTQVSRLSIRAWYSRDSPPLRHVRRLRHVQRYVPKRSNSPFRTPPRNACHSAGVNRRTGPAESLLLRTPIPPPGRLATSTQLPLA
jgi:hypothetical protein